MPSCFPSTPLLAFTINAEVMSRRDALGHKALSGSYRAGVVETKGLSPCVSSRGTREGSLNHGDVLSSCYETHSTLNHGDVLSSCYETHSTLTLGLKPTSLRLLPPHHLLPCSFCSGGRAGWLVTARLLVQAGCGPAWVTPPLVCDCVHEWVNVSQHCIALWIKALYK